MQAMNTLLYMVVALGLIGYAGFGGVVPMSFLQMILAMLMTIVVFIPIAVFANRRDNIVHLRNKKHKRRLV